jgi:hypothetical protein
MHRKYEQRVNYFKAKVKNLVTDENARLSKENSVKIAEVIRENEKMNKEFNVVYTKFLDEKLKSKQDFETTRQEKIKETASLRIQVDGRFQEVIDEFLNKLS